MIRTEIFVALSFAALPGMVSAQTPAGLADLVGARAAGGEAQLRTRGYDFVRTTTGDDRKWSVWWNPDRRQCLTVATVDGRYASITPSPAPDCDQRAGGADSSRDRDRGYHPDIGYRGSSPPRTASPSYAPDDAPIRVGDREVDIGLVCFGDGQRPTTATRYGWSWNERRDRYDFGNRTELTSEQFDASMMVQIWAGGGRIRLPGKLVPPIHSRGQDGWWDLYNISIQPDRITGEYRLNGLNRPKLTIDRRSGRITIRGLASYAFRGTCDMIDGRDHRRF